MRRHTHRTEDRDRKDQIKTERTLKTNRIMTQTINHRTNTFFFFFFTFNVGAMGLNLNVSISILTNSPDS